MPAADAQPFGDAAVGLGLGGLRQNLAQGQQAGPLADALEVRADQALGLGGQPGFDLLERRWLRGLNRFGDQGHNAVLPATGGGQHVAVLYIVAQYQLEVREQTEQGERNYGI